jgi:hypothetical protein
MPAGGTLSSPRLGCSGRSGSLPGTWIAGGGRVPDVWTLIWLTMLVHLVLSWLWRRGRAGLLLPLVGSGVGALLFAGSLVFDLSPVDPGRWMPAWAFFAGLLPGTFMLCLALAVRAERRAGLRWPAVLAGMAFLACLLLLLAMWMTPRGGMIG